MNFPNYDDLPLLEGTNDRCAWPVFNGGKAQDQKDVYGCLNKITLDAVREAAKEVRDGVSISLNWPLNGWKESGYLRKALVRHVWSYMDANINKDSRIRCHAFDDEIAFNTQCSSQWDSFCHYLHQDSQSGYNGAKPTIENLSQTGGAEEKGQFSLPTLDHWHNRGGLVTRGVLIDYKAYADTFLPAYTPFTDHPIKPADLETIAHKQNVTFRPGDVILIRTGYTEALTGLSAEGQRQLMSSHKYAGVENSVDAVRWFWNTHCAAVASDNDSFEVYPPASKGGLPRDLVIHQHFLALLGIPIGELWDLKALSEYCAKTGRYTFMLTSVPLNVPKSVGSPANALAIF